MKRVGQISKKEAKLKKSSDYYKSHNEIFLVVIISLVLLMALINILQLNVSAATYPQGPDDLTNIENRTKANVSAKMINISGGTIGVLDINATVQNPRWKAFVGNVTGKFTLDDAGGSTIYDWTLSSITGRIYATRNASYIDWTNINCSNISDLEAENILMEHSSADDNITKTFNATWNNTQNYTESGAHNPFYVGSTYIGSDLCPTLKTYVANETQESDFEEMALYDGVSMVYATILESDAYGYDNDTYDFQMLVPENGNASFSGATAYYIYVEIGS